jgi:hypothetical protein
MRRIATLIVLLALFTVTLMAGDMTSAPTSDLSVASDQAKPAEAPKAPQARRVYPGGAGETGGWLFKSVFGEGLQKKTGIQIEHYIQMGCATNTATDKFSANFGQGSWPDPVVQDTGCAFQDMDMVIHRDMVANLLSGVGPLPGPTPKKVSWGFYQNTLWGRSGSSAEMTGFDKQWAINDPGDYYPNYAQVTKQNQIALPNAWGAVYLPLLKGMMVRFGRYGAGIGWDIPPGVRPGPDFFPSKSFSMVTEPSQVLGVELSANILRDPKLGYLMGEFGIHNGWQVSHPVSGKKDFNVALHYRTPKMGTGIKYSAVFGPKNILPGAACTNTAASGGSGLCSSNLQGPGNMSAANFVVPGQVWNGARYIPGWVSAGLSSLPAGVGTWGVSSQYLGSYYHVISPRSQEGLSNAVTIYHNFSPKLRWVGEASYGKQWGDGRSDTLLYVGPNHYMSGYKGGSYWGVMSFATYQFKPKWAIGFRGEHLNNQSGLAMYPTCAFYGSAAPGGQMSTCKVNLEDVALSVHYEPSKFIMLWPEVRYDWTGDAHGLNIWGVQNLDVAYTTATTGGIVPMNSANLLPAATALSRNNNAHSHNFVADFNVMLYF